VGFGLLVLAGKAAGCRGRGATSWSVSVIVGRVEAWKMVEGASVTPGVVLFNLFSDGWVIVPLVNFSEGPGVCYRRNRVLPENTH